MPLVSHHETSPTGELGIWEVTEGVNFFVDKLSLYPEEAAEIEALSARKTREWFASRHLLHLMSKREIRGACLKDEYGKPYLQGSSYHISMSHTSNLVAVIASPFYCGIDIQVIVSKIVRIKHKFVSDSEASYIPPENEIAYLHFLWGAKESIYKAHGIRNLDFKKNMSIDPFVISKYGKVKTSGTLVYNNEKRFFHVLGIINEEYTLVYVLEKSDINFCFDNRLL